MKFDGVRLATVLTVSAAVLAGCDRGARSAQACGAQGRRADGPACRSSQGAHGGYVPGAFGWRRGGPDAGGEGRAGVARGGFGATAEGLGGAGHGGAGE